MAAICKLVLTMGQLMAAAGASAPLLQGDAAPATARAGCSADYERSSASEKTGMQLPLHPPYTMVLR